MVGSVLLLLLSGLAVTAVLNRVVAVVWKAPERDYLEPQLDDDLIPGLYPAVALACSVAAPVILLEVDNQLGAAGLLILFFGLLAPSAL